MQSSGGSLLPGKYARGRLMGRSVAPECHCSKGYNSALSGFSSLDALALDYPPLWPHAFRRLRGAVSVLAEPIW